MCPVTYPSQPVLTILSPSFPRRPYKSRDDNSNPKKEGEGGRDEGPPPYVRDPHWGQRKLFLNELELLTKYGEDGDVVVYAGAAPGRHIEHLSKELFPTLKFVLVDPAPFRIRESESLKLVAGLMTDALAREYAGAWKSALIEFMFYLFIYLLIYFVAYVRIYVGFYLLVILSVYMLLIFFCFLFLCVYLFFNIYILCLFICLFIGLFVFVFIN